MKKVCIITFFNELNYGAALQAYALQQKVKQLGAEVTFLGTSLDTFTSSEKKTIKDKLIKILNISKDRQFEKFRSNEFKIEDNSSTYESVKNRDLNCDLLICGSDQIWNPKITNGLQPYYFGKDIQCNKKISYAASCGSIDTIADNINQFVGLISGFDLLSVRESVTCSFLNDKNINSQCVVDPTLLLKKDEWNCVAEKSNLKGLPKKYIFVYDLEGTNHFITKVNEVSNSLGLPVVSLRRRSHYCNNSIRFPHASPYDFVNLVKNAETVISNSYHALVFSSIFYKKIYAIPHTKYAERMISFLDLYNIRLNNSDCQYVNFSIQNRAIIEKEIDDSILFLKQAL